MSSDVVAPDQEYGIFDGDPPAKFGIERAEKDPPGRRSPSSATEASERSDDEPLPPIMLRIPNSAFGISMGLAGHAIMWKELRSGDFSKIGIDEDVADAFGAISWCAACVVVCVVAACYAHKLLASFPLARAEYLNEVRIHFFNAPNLTFVMLLIGAPPGIVDVPGRTLRILWAVAFCYQIVMTGYVYKAWMFSKNRNFTEAKPQFLLSTVGWFLLSNLGSSCDIRDEWGIGLPRMCFGAGFMLYVDIIIFVFGKLHENRGMKGSPPMFLLIAPPSVGVVSLDLLNDGGGGGDSDDFSPSGEMLLGWVYVLLLLLLRLDPVIWRAPSVMGEYWAYVFPIAAATTATIRYASALNTMTTEVLAMIMIVMSVVSLLLVFARMSFHAFRCYRGEDHWRDPLFHKDKYSTRRLGDLGNLFFPLQNTA